MALSPLRQEAGAAVIAPEHAAALILATASLIGLCANPVAKWFASEYAKQDRMVSDALDPEPDYEANIAARWVD